jgi:hypothetical protein
VQSQRSLAVCLFLIEFRHDVRSVLVREEWKDRFSLTPEDYLHGVITVINELVRNS